MKKKDHIVCQTTPWTSKDFIRTGIGIFVMGLLLVLVSLAFYLNGSEAQLVNTKWGTEIAGRELPHNPFYFFLVICSGIVSAGGVFLLCIGIVQRVKMKLTR